jgi:S1-C subfamily serine protease
LVALLNGTGRAASVLVRGWGALGPPPRLLLLGGAFAAVALVALVITAMVNSPAEYPRHVATPKAAQSIVRPPSSPGTLPSPITSPQPPGAPEQGDAAQLVARVDPAVVTIRVTVAGDAGREGSGFVVDESGLVITNYHVVEKAMWAHVIFQDKKESKVDGFLACAPGKDLALLKIDPAGRKLPMLRIAGAAPAKGEKVYAFGAPLGFSGSVSDGLVAAVRHADDMREILGDELYVRLLEYDMDTDWIQTTAPISHGNSGGPLVNAQGEVVGVNTLAPPVGQNLNFAVSATHVRHLLRGPPSIPRPLSELPPRRPP